MTRSATPPTKATLNLGMSVLLWISCAALAVLADYRGQEMFEKIFWCLWAVCVLLVLQWGWVVARELREQQQ
jgi:hypothetical protein